MIVTIHQPEYLPWIGFFDRIYKSDVFVILDDVQYQKWGFINRNKIKTPQGWQWITIPIKERESRKKINEMIIDNQKDWGKDHWKTLFFNYKKASCFEKCADFFKDVFEKKWKFIADLDIYLLENILEMLGIKKRIEKTSLMDVEGKATERLVNICKKLGADTYLAGPGWGTEDKEYMDVKRFEEENIKIIRQEFSHPVYPQQFEKVGFTPYLSIVDLIFNCGEKSLDIIKGKNL